MFLQDCLTFPDLPATAYIYIPGENYKTGVGTKMKNFGIDSTYFPQGAGKVKQLWSAWVGSKIHCRSKVSRCSGMAMSRPYI